MKASMWLGLASLAAAAAAGACENPPVQPHASASVAGVTSDCCSISINGPDVLYQPNNACWDYRAIVYAEGLPIQDPIVTWHLSDIRVARFTAFPNAQEMTSFEPVEICGNGTGLGYVDLTANWHSSFYNANENDTKSIEYGQTSVGLQPANVTIAPSTFILNKNQTVQLTAYGVDQFGHTKQKTASWEVDLPAIATVNQSGTVTGVSKGDAHVRATVNNKTSDPPATITVLGVQTVTVTPSSATIIAGQTVALTATARDQFGNIMTGVTATWRSSDLTVATVSPGGVVSGVNDGQATITATMDGVEGTSAITVNPAPPPPPPPPPYVEGPTDVNSSPTCNNSFWARAGGNPVNVVTWASSGTINESSVSVAYIWFPPGGGHWVEATLEDGSTAGLSDIISSSSGMWCHYPN